MLSFGWCPSGPVPCLPHSPCACVCVRVCVLQVRRFAWANAIGNAQRIRPTLFDILRADAAACRVDLDGSRLNETRSASVSTVDGATADPIRTRNSARRARTVSTACGTKPTSRVLLSARGSGAVAHRQDSAVSTPSCAGRSLRSIAVDLPRTFGDNHTFDSGAFRVKAPAGNSTRVAAAPLCVVQESPTCCYLTTDCTMLQRGVLCCNGLYYVATGCAMLRHV